ncbi:GNAT family N-acetyltransferase [Flavisericum labens]|uniref:GNAT family N-acetyltransferase n=1 Tax=Flavisericum labens TaxID=3377112 RepID=UPI00387B57A4
MNYNIKQITANKTYEIRQPILRTGQPIETCFFEGDNLETTYHLGIFSEEKLVGVSSFFKNNNSLFTISSQYQLRGMAILKNYQKHGLGRDILKQGEQMLKLKNVNLIWCNAREVAINFYAKNGYQIIGDPFNIKDIGLHFVMYKSL